MTEIKLCGLSRACDIDAANALRPEYIGFVFAPGSRRRITPETADRLRCRLNPGISAVGVFVNEPPQNVARLLRSGIIDMAQLHGSEDAEYIARLRALARGPVIQAFRVQTAADIRAAGKSAADFILLDAGAGDGETFDWTLLRNAGRPYFLAGGLSPDNAGAAAALRPYAVDVSSGIETDGVKDPEKMRAFVRAVRAVR